MEWQGLPPLTEVEETGREAQAAGLDKEMDGPSGGLIANTILLCRESEGDERHGNQVSFGAGKCVEGTGSDPEAAHKR